VALQEALFEVRFPAIEDYAIFAGGMAVTHKTDFPVIEKIEPQGIPDFILISGLIRHRFSSQDKSKLFQLGNDVLSINYIRYTGFEHFVKDIKEILSSARLHGVKISHPTRIGLRYINRFDNVSNPFDFLNVNSPFQNKDDLTKIVQIKKVDQIEIGLFLDINLSFNSNDKILILDLDSFYENSEQQENLDGQWTEDKLIDWTRKVHDLIKENYKNLVPQSKEEVEV
jgi:uncharacterized protein (TIGR04255 family)